MKLITQIKIENFRSLKNVTISNLEGFNSFAGLNNAGKSNILKALNAFFNNETLPNEKISIDKDYTLQKRTRRKKTISVSLTFELPEKFNFRQGLKDVKSLLSARSFNITREWYLEGGTEGNKFLLNGKGLDVKKSSNIDTFLKLIQYRYIPDRVSPIEIITKEERSFNTILGQRIKKSVRGEDNTMPQNYLDKMKSATKNLTKNMRMRSKIAQLPEPEVRVPTDISEILFDLKYSVDVNGGSISHNHFGSGAQSHLMIETLKIVDGSFENSFGWKQAVIWGIEEPEISLHNTLEAKMAFFLKSFANERNNRFQIFCTTHSNLMLQYSDKITEVKQAKNGASEVRQFECHKEAINQITENGITYQVDPILQYPLQPIVLVEGKTDKDFIRQALNIMAPALKVSVFDITDLDVNEESGGKDKLKKYLKLNKLKINIREQSTSIFVLMDPDAKNDQRDINEYLGNGVCFIWKEEDKYKHAPKDIDGIEGFYSERIWEKAYEDSKGKNPKKKLIRKDEACNPKYSLSEKAEQKNVKRKLNEIINNGIIPEDLKHTRPVLEKLVKCLRGIPPSADLFD